MAIDSNLYAVQIELDMDADTAFRDLDTLETSVLGLETKLQNFLSKFATDMSTSFKELDSNISSISKSLIDNNIVGVQQNNLQAESLDIQKEISEELVETGELQIKYRDVAEELGELQIEYQKSIEDGIEVSKARNVLLENYNKLSNFLLSTSASITGESDRLGQSTERNIARAERHNKKQRSILWTIRASVRALDSMIGPWIALTRGTEDFTTANYRAFGSQHALLFQSQRLGSEIGMFGDAAKEAYRELMNIRVPQEMMDEYVTTVVMAGRVTGVSNKVLAEYTRSMKGGAIASGEASEMYQRTARSLEVLAYAQQKYNLTTGEVSKIVELQTEKMTELKFIYGKDFPESMGISLAMMANMANQAGESTKAIDDLAKLMSVSGVEALRMEGMFGSRFGEGAEGRFDAIIAKTDELGTAYKKNLEEGMDPNIAIETLRINAGIFGISEEMVRSVADAKERAAIADITLTEQLAIERAEIQKNADMNKQFTDAMNTLYAAYEKIKTPLLALIAVVAEFIAFAMVPMLNVLSAALNLIVRFINGIRSMWIEAEKAIPALGYVRMALSGLLSGVIFIVAVLPAFVAGISAITTAFLALISRTFLFRNVLNALTSAISSSFRTLGVTIKTFLGAIGKGVAAFGRAIAPVVAPILALSLGLMAAGWSAMKMAEAVKIIAKEGDQGIKILAALVIAIGALGFALVKLGIMALGAATGIGSLALVFIAVATAAYILANAFKVSATAFKIIADSAKTLFDAITISNIKNLVLFTLALNGLIGVGILGVVGLPPLAAQLWALGRATNTLANNLQKMEASLRLLLKADYEDLKKSLTDLKVIINGLSNTAIYLKDFYVAIAVTISFLKDLSEALKQSSSMIVDLNRLRIAFNNITVSAKSTNISIEGIATSINSLNLAISSFDISSLEEEIAKFNDLEINPDKLIESIDNVTSILDDLEINPDKLISNVESAISKFNDLEMNPDKLVASILSSAAKLQDSIGILSDPTNKLSAELTEITAKIEEINRLQIQMEKISSQVKSVPTEDKNNIGMPNETRRIEKTNETLKVSENVKEDLDEKMLIVLSKILTVLETNALGDSTGNNDIIGDYDASNDTRKLGVMV